MLLSLGKFTVIDLFETHIELLLYSYIIHGSFEQNMLYLFCPSQQSTRELRPVQGHYIWNNHIKTKLISQKNLNYRNVDRISSVSDVWPRMSPDWSIASIENGDSLGPGKGLEAFLKTTDLALKLYSKIYLKVHMYLPKKRFAY